MTLFFPPFRTGESGRTPLHCARQGHRRSPHFSERPARFDAHIYVHAARTAGFGPAAKPELFEQCLNFESDPAHISPTNTRNRIKIDPQFVGVFKIVGPDRMGM